MKRRLDQLKNIEEDPFSHLFCLDHHHNQLPSPKTSHYKLQASHPHLVTMYPNGQAYLAMPDAPEGSTRFPQARLAPISDHRTIYVSGTACCRPDGTWPGVTENSDGTWILDIQQQTAAVLENIDNIIKDATDGKGGIHNLIDAVVYILDMESQYAGMNEQWNKVFKTRESAPARATIGVRELPDARMIVEVKAVAVVDF
jgi:2-aminomuconate deaminase